MEIENLSPKRRKPAAALWAEDRPAWSWVFFSLAAEWKCWCSKSTRFFSRDFRGDTIHPSTFELMYELGLLDEFPEAASSGAARNLGPCSTILKANNSGLFPPADPLQIRWLGCRNGILLNFIAEKAKAYPQFHLQMETEVTDLVFENGNRGENGRVAGARAKNACRRALEVGADLVVGAGGRRSIVREKAGLEVIDLGAPIDVLWMRVSRQPADPIQTLGRFRDGKLLVTLDRGDYWQCAYVIAKGAFDAIREKGLPAFREDMLKRWRLFCTTTQPN